MVYCQSQGGEAEFNPLADVGRADDKSTVEVENAEEHNTIEAVDKVGVIVTGEEVAIAPGVPSAIDIASADVVTPEDMLSIKYYSATVNIVCSVKVFASSEQEVRDYIEQNGLAVVTLLGTVVNLCVDEIVEDNE